MIRTGDLAPPKHPLRVLREARGWSRERFAALAYVDVSTVSRWERCVTVPQHSTQLHLARLFGVAVEELGFADAGPGGATRWPAPSAYRTHRDAWGGRPRRVAETPSPQPPRADLEALPVDQRKFARTLGMFVGGLAVEGYTAEPHRFVRALETRSVDETTLTALEQTLASVRHLHLHMSPGNAPPGGVRGLMPPVLRNFQAIRTLLEDHQSLSVRRRLTHLGSQYATEVGSFSAAFFADLGPARSYLHAAFTGAREIGDNNLAAHILGRTARAVLEQPVTGATPDAAREALDLLGRARTLARRATPRGRAWLASLSAEAHARLGDRSATWRHLEAAHELIHRTAEEVPGWEFFDPSRLARNAGDCHVRLRDTRHADEWCREGLRLQGDDQPINTAVSLLDLALTRVLDGEIDEAASLAGRALSLPPSLRVASVTARSGEVQQALEPYGSSPAVRDLDELLAAS